MLIPTAPASYQVPETVDHLSLCCCRFSNTRVPLILEQLFSFGVLSAKSYVPSLHRVVYGFINSYQVYALRCARDVNDYTF